MKRWTLPLLLFLAVPLYLWLSGAMDSGTVAVEGGGGTRVEDAGPSSPTAQDDGRSPGSVEGVRSSLDPAGEELAPLPAAALGAISGRLLRERDRSPITGVELYLAEFDTESITRTWSAFGLSVAPRSPVRILARTHSDQEGRFSFLKVRPRGIRVLGIGPGSAWVGMRVLSDDPPRGALVDIGDLLLADRGSVSGRLVDADGRPVTGATLRVVDLPPALGDLAMKRFDPLGMAFVGWAEDEFTVLPMPAWLHELEPDLPFPCARSDAEGMFVIEGVRVGRSTLIVQAPTALPMTREVTVHADQQRELGKLVLQGGKQLAGQVVDAAGKGVAGLRMCCGEAVFGSSIGFLSAPVTGDAEGRFTIPAVGRRPQRLFVQRRPGTRWMHFGEHLPGAPVRIVLPGTCRLRVEVVLADGSPAPAADLELLPCDQLVTLPGLFRSLDEPVAFGRVEPGVWAADGLEAGDWRLCCKVAGHAPAVTDIVLGSEEPTTLRMRLVAGRRLVVNVTTRDGRPVPAARVFWLDPAPAAVEGSTLGSAIDDIPLCLGATGRDGILVVPDLPRIPLGLQVEHPAHASALVRLEATQDDCAVVLVTGGSVRGTILERGGVPEQRYTVVASNEGDGDPDPSEHLMPHLCHSDAQGRFAFEGLEDGPWNIEVMSDLSSFKGIGEFIQAAMQDRMDWKSVRIEARDGREEEVVIRLGVDEDAAGPGVIEGTVRMDGKPVEGLMVQGWAERSFKSRTDAQGRFRLDGLPQQDVWVSITGQSADIITERMIWNGKVDLGAHPVRTLYLDFATATLDFELVDQKGQPIDEWLLELELAEPPSDSVAGGASYQGFLRGGGRLTLQGVRHGRYKLSVQPLKDGDLCVPPRTLVVPTDGRRHRLVAEPPITVGGTLQFGFDGVAAGLRKVIEKRLAVADADQSTLVLGDSDHARLERKGAEWRFRFDKVAPQQDRLCLYCAGLTWSSEATRFERSRDDLVIHLRPEAESLAELDKELGANEVEGSGSGKR